MTNKEFLFIFDAALSNPNGDPDQENKPRMDRATKTNLVSDTRLKRNIRDYLINTFKDSDTDKDVFVRMMGENKVSVDKRLMLVMGDVVLNREKLIALINKHKDLLSAFENLKKQAEEPQKTKKGDELKPTQSFSGDYFDLYNKFFDANGFSSAPFKAVPSQKSKASFFDIDAISLINNELLTAIIKDVMIDIRYFGSAVAVKGFSRTFTGPIQVNFGYSLHPVELSDTNTTVTIMSGSTEGESNIGKKEKLKYSLIGFTGTINAKRGDIVGLKEEDDLSLFRKSIVLSILNNDSDSKKNQHPHLYLEIDYNENEIYGRIGDLRNLIDLTSKVDQEEKDFTKVRSIDDIDLDFHRLVAGIEIIAPRIQKVRIWTSINLLAEAKNLSDGSSSGKKIGLFQLENVLKEKLSADKVETLQI